MGNSLTPTTKQSVVEGSAKQTSPPLVLMTTPDHPMAREAIGDQVWTGFLMRFEGTLSERDQFLLHNPTLSRA
jgi:hypothetical protein